MAKKSNMDGLDLDTLSGRLAYAIKIKGPKFISENTSMSIAQANRLSAQKTGTTLESAAEIAIATGFELKWIALGKGPMMTLTEFVFHTDPFTEIAALDDSQKINMAFDPEFLQNGLDVKPEDCRIWDIDYKANLKGLERGHTVLIDTRNQKKSGLLLVETNNQKRIVDALINMDCSVTITMDNEVIQTLTAEQFTDLVILGEVIWHGGQS